MRLFTAVDLPEAARAAIVDEQRRIAGARAGGSLKLVRPEHLHLTLVFIGEVADARGAEIARIMAEAIPMAPFDLVFRGVGAFPPRGAPRVLFLDTADGRESAIELYRHTADRLAATGVEVGRRPYHPHLTLGRWRESRPSDRPREGRGATIAAIEVQEVALFQSRLSSTGPAYTRLTAARLGCS